MPKFPRKDRILSAIDFKRVKSGGISVSCGRIKIAALSSDAKRLGIVIGSSCGGAVKRNRFKRVVREHFRLNREQYPKADVVVIARPGIENLCNAEIRSLLERALNLISRKI